MRNAVFLAAFSAVLLAGCSSEPAAQEAIKTALSFVGGGAQQKCELLAPDTLDRVADDPSGCPDALEQLGLPRGSDVRAAEVAGMNAQVVLGDQVVFLARFNDGWRVTAAGCSRTNPDPAVPYDCEVQP